MNPFTFSQAETREAALAQVAGNASFAGEAVRFIAGGTNLIDLMKEGVMVSSRLVDINRLPLDAIEEEGEGLRLGATARNADTAYHPLVRERYPLLTAAILAGASPQLRNMASNAGNLLQRTRCYYFYDVGTPCNKREPGSGCSAIGGITRQHAILGASEHCIATHQSDMCVALAALEATVHVESARGKRAIPFNEFHRLPDDAPQYDTVLEADELITHITLPDARRYAAHSAYIKVRERLSYAFALVSVAAALDIGADGVIRSARIALGSVAHKPWRKPEAEALLEGQKEDPALFGRVADLLLEGALGQGHNDFKIGLARKAIVRALQTAVQGTVTNTGEPND
ncbi:xanthine dehydrogenase family protein subunit M [Massilia sp. Leaf139]|uniref:FAD binding domain-containing protein n=1 Tax=Massilia sp. Leaf139 TaxID=1736272 RepID=UPI0006F667BD|nr:xanthine dehydrogenase family protein subunit M [Massilia sp. Leaf139]KQQ88435.1 FAD-binding molybdopterin dehydrogenase [Massilia sp. Leaf139]